MMCKKISDNIMDLKSLVKPKNSLLQKQLYSKIFKDIFTELSSFENYEQLKNDNEYVVMACNLLELLTDVQKKHFKSLKIDKKQLICNVYESLFNITEEERLNLEERIQFIYDNNLIKKISTSRLLKKKFNQIVSTQFSLL